MPSFKSSRFRVTPAGTCRLSRMMVEQAFLFWLTSRYPSDPVKVQDVLDALCVSDAAGFARTSENPTRENAAMVSLNMSPHISVEIQMSWIRTQTTCWGERNDGRMP